MKKHNTSDDILLRQLMSWLQRAGPKHRERCEALPLRRDVVTVLTYVRDHKVVGTQSTGNFSLKVVRAVTAGFVNPPALDTTIGDRVYRLRSEDDVWPLVFVHTLANVAGLILLGRGRRWQLTANGEQFLTASPEFQVWILLETWWNDVNWAIAYPFTGLGDGPPSNFEAITLDHLLALPVESRIPFESFADQLVQATGIRWTSQDTSFHQTALRWAVQRMVIGILAKFEVLESEFQDKPLGKSTTQDLVAFQITPLGRDLLQSLAV